MAAEQTDEFVVIEPEWERTCEYFAEVLAQHGFQKWAYEPITSFMEQVRYLAIKDPEALERVMRRLKAKESPRLEWDDDRR